MRWQDLFPISGNATEWTRRWSYDVFISHAGEDTFLAREIFKWLRERNVRCFLDQASISRTNDVGGCLDRVMSQCRFCLCLITQEYCQNNWTIIEYEYFLEREQTEGRCLLPVLLKMDSESFTSQTQRQWTQSGPILEIDNPDEAFTGDVFDDVGRPRKSFSRDHLQLIREIVCKKIQAATIALERRKRDHMADSEASMPAKRARQVGKIFISHAGEEKDKLARPIFRKLEAKGFQAFLDDESIGPERIRDGIYRGIRESTAAVFIFTENFFSKTWPLRELELFLFMEYYVRSNFGNVLKIFQVAPYTEMPQFLEAHRQVAERRVFTGRDWRRVRTGSASERTETVRAIQAQPLDDSYLPDFADAAVDWISDDMSRGDYF